MKTVVQNSNGTQTVVGLEDGALVTGTVQDCTPILDAAKARHNAGYTGSADMRLAASVPFVVVEKYCNDNGITYHEFSASQDHKKRLLNDSALSYFRIWNGRV